MLIWIIACLMILFGFALSVHGILKYKKKNIVNDAHQNLLIEQEVGIPVVPRQERILSDELMLETPSSELPANNTDDNQHSSHQNVDVEESLSNEQVASESESEHRDAITLFVYPREGVGSATPMIEGMDIIKLMKRYSMLYDVKSGIFYKYNDEKGRGKAWFGMIGIYADEFHRFDLNELSRKGYRALAFFVSLPHSQPLHAFDAMVQVTGMIADELFADVYSKNLDTQELVLIDEVWINSNRAKLQSHIPN